MAHTLSAKKRLRQNEKRRLNNQSRERRMKTHYKQALNAVEANDAEALRKVLAPAIAELDRAAGKDVIHPKNAARKKSRLQRSATAILR